MKIAITGASGKTGYRISEEAIKKGHKVRQIIRKNSKILEKYSEAILFLDSKDQSKGINYLTELLKSPNEKIKILSATKLLDIYLQQKKFADLENFKMLGLV